MSVSNKSIGNSGRCMVSPPRYDLKRACCRVIFTPTRGTIQPYRRKQERRDIGELIKGVLRRWRRGQDSNLQELSLGSFQDYFLTIRIPLLQIKQTTV